MPISRHGVARRFLAEARLLLICILGLTFVHTAYAAIPDVVFTVGNVTSTYNDTISVPVQVSDLTGDGIVSYEFQLTDNSSNVAFAGLDISGTLSSAGTVIDNPSNNTTKVSGMFTSALSGSGTLVKILVVANGAGTATITPSNVIFNTTGVTNLNSGNLTVEAPNSAPVIDPIADISFQEDNSYALDLTQYISDPDESIGSLTISAQLVSGSGLSINQDTQNHTVTFVPDANVYGAWDIHLQVEDSGGLTASQTFTVNVNAVNDAPVISSVQDQSMVQGETLVISLSAQDVDGDNLTFSASSNASAVQASVSGTDLTLVAGAAYVGSATIQVSVSDGTAQNGTSFQVVVTPAFTAGDVDDNTLIQSYDAALTLQYSVGMDPLPQTDPRPWENWRLTRADVDGNSMVAAYDASLIQQHVIGIIDQFPVEATPKTQQVQIPQDLTFSYNQNGHILELYVDQTAYLYGANLEVIFDPAKVQFTTVDTTNLSADYRYEVNTVNENDVCLGMMIAEPPSGGGLFLSLGINVVEETEIEIRENINAQDTVITTVPLHLMTTGTVDNGEVPANYALQDNYPNPFNPTTNISYDLPRQTYVSLGIYNILGRRIATLVNETQASGRHVIQWNGNDDFGNEVSNGAYFYRIQTPEFSAVKKMVFMK